MKCFVDLPLSDPLQQTHKLLLLRPEIRRKDLELIHDTDVHDLSIPAKEILSNYEYSVIDYDFVLNYDLLSYGTRNDSHV